MRKITQQAINAFLNGKAFSLGNTSVSINHDGAVCLSLHGNLIAIRYADGKRETEITNASWFTSTTKERLNGIPGVRINQKKGKWYLNGKEWDGNWIKV